MDFMLHSQLVHSLESGDLERLANAPAADERDLLCTLLSIYELSAPLVGTLSGKEQYQTHPVITEIRERFDRWLIDALDVQVSPLPAEPDDAIEALAWIADRDGGAVYEWLAEQADWHQLVCFLAVEEPALASALRLPLIETDALPLTALTRAALHGLLATNGSLKAEMFGARGLLELQAGPRGRLVLTALRRLGAPTDLLALCAERADTDPRRGQAWLDGVLRPVVAQQPDWRPRIVRGALWRSSVDARLFRDLHESIATRDLSIA
jgi:hypothetical protein